MGRTLSNSTGLNSFKGVFCRAEFKDTHIKQVSSWQKGATDFSPASSSSLRSAISCLKHQALRSLDTLG